MDRESDRRLRAISYFTSTKAERPANFFPLPNAIFHIELSTGAIAVYSYLMYCEGRKSHQCWPSYKTIGKAVGMSENMLGHYDAGFTLRTYTHATRQKQEQAAEKMGNFMDKVM